MSDGTKVRHERHGKGDSDLALAGVQNSASSEPDLYALEDGRVLRVCRQDVDTVLSCKRQHVRPARNQRLLVGQADVLARLDGRHGRLEPRAAHDACESHNEDGFDVGLPAGVCLLQLSLLWHRQQTIRG